MIQCLPKIIKSPKRYIIFLAIGAILIFAFWLRIYNIENQGLWFDEILTAATSENDLSYIINESNSWLHYIFVKIGQFFQYSVVAMKMPGIIAGVSSVLVLFFIGRELKNNLTGLVAAALGALFPVHMYYSQEVRYYPYLLLFAALFFFSFLKLYKTKKVLWGVAFLCNCSLLVLTHYSGIVLISGFIIWQVIDLLLLFVSKIKKKKYVQFNYVAFACLLIVILVAVGILIFSNQSHISSVLASNLSSLKISETVYFGTTYFTIPAKHYPWQEFVSYLAKFFTVDSNPGVIFFSSVFFIGCIFLLKKKWAVAIFCLVPLLLTILGPLLINVKHWWDHKYFIYYLPVWISLISFGFISLAIWITGFIKKYKLRTYFKNGLILIFMIISITLLFSPVKAALKNNHVQQYDWQKVASYLTEIVSPGDIIILSNNGMSQISFLYFFNNGPGVPYTAGDNTAEEVGNFVYPQYFRKMNPRHIYNNKQTIITSYSVLLGDPRTKINEIIDAQASEADIWVVSINSPRELGLSDLMDQELVEKIGGIGVYRVHLKDDMIPMPLILTTKDTSSRNRVKLGRPNNFVVMWNQNNISVDGSSAALKNGMTSGNFVFPVVFEDNENILEPKEIELGLRLLLPQNSGIKVLSSRNGLDFTEVKVIDGPCDNSKKEYTYLSFIPLYNKEKVTYLKFELYRKDVDINTPQLIEVKFSGKFEELNDN